ncbi:MAG: hypothetical protein ACRDRV_12670, partial [Pseudonocardiaceae bacterium]
MDVTSDAVVLTCGDAHWPGTPSVTMVSPMPSPPGREDLRQVLASLDGRRLVVCGTDADLAAVLLRLLRADALAAVTVGYAPTSAGSAVARLCDLPVAPAAAAQIALHGEPRPMPLVRDDAGGLLVGLG